MPSVLTPPSLRLVICVSIAFIYLSVLVAMPCRAQTTSGTLIGNVRDASGAKLGRAKVTIINEENGNARATRSDNGGNFTLFNLPPGIYRATAAKEGFIDQTVKSFPVQFNQKNVIRLPQFTLRLASLQGTVTDSASIALPDATVVVASPSARVRRSVTTNSQGQYYVSDLPTGHYVVTALWQGGPARGVATVPVVLDRVEVFAPSLKLTE